MRAGVNSVAGCPVSKKQAVYYFENRQAKCWHHAAEGLLDSMGWSSGRIMSSPSGRSGQISTEKRARSPGFSHLGDRGIVVPCRLAGSNLPQARL